MKYGKWWWKLRFFGHWIVAGLGDCDGGGFAFFKMNFEGVDLQF